MHHADDPDNLDADNLNPENLPPGNLDRELDALLDQARWPEPPPQAQMRLREQWLELSQSRSRRVLRLAPMAAAAMLVLAIGGAWFLWRQDGRVATETAADVASQLPPPPVVAYLPPPPPPPPAAIVPQAPTPREMLAVLAPSRPVVDVRAAVKRAIDSVTQDEFTSALESLRGLRMNVVERELILAFATTEINARRRAAVRLLAELGGPSSAALLAKAARDPKLSAEAMPGVARLGDVESLVALTRAAHPGPRREAVAQLLGLGSERAVTEFLALVLDDATREDALAALHGASAPPVEQLMAALDSAHVDRRLAAAKSLGTLCHRPDVGAALRQMVTTNRHRREALAALLSCPSQDATTFINTARARSSIDAEVRAVQTELQRIF
ncbi:MAG TPA: hypothetical protein VGR35_14075 [Tepidisphaeraceae bacterium]|nr:hypothetical protein [Tepidisphaeraceae bacterium]